LESDCIALLAYVWEHRSEEQTYTGLAKATGIPYETIRQMVQWHKKDPNNWALRNYGTKYGYVVRYLGKKTYPRRWHIKIVHTTRGDRTDVSLVLHGRTHRIGQFMDPTRAEVFLGNAETRMIHLERKIVDVVYVGTTQDPDGKLLIDDVPEYHPSRDDSELRAPEHRLEEALG
jgi:hypothetical protein